METYRLPKIPSEIKSTMTTSNQHIARRLRRQQPLPSHNPPAPTWASTQHRASVAATRQEPSAIILTQWQQSAIQTLLAEQKTCPVTPIFLLCRINGIDVYAKDESTQPTGSHKHRLARSLLLYGLRNGWIDQNTNLVDASSGGTACSEAYLANLLEIPQQLPLTP